MNPVAGLELYMALDKEMRKMEELLGGEELTVYIRRTLGIRYKACPISAALALTRIRWENFFCGCRKGHFCGVGGGNTEHIARP